jgi:predicted acetyltransferase
MAPDGVLLDALADRWALRTVGEHDTLWVRLLDVPAALASRRYRVPGRLVLRVDPPLREGDAPPVGGVVELDVAADGTVRAVPGGAPADLRLGAAELASVWLGGGSLSSLAAVGRVEELTPGALPLADAMFGWSPLPRVTLEF